MTPYTYLIGWTKYNKYYYGCQYGRTAHPSNLWKTYFTSSRYVTELRKQLGEPDVVQIRQTFSTRVRCVRAEKRAVQVVVKHPHFINKNVAGAIISGNPTPRTQKQIEAARRNIRTALGKAPKDRAWQRTEKYRNTMSKATSAAIRGKVWFSNTRERRKYFPGTEPESWQRGWKLNN